MSKVYKVALTVLSLWLFCWVYVAWAAIQDDALIHLRYADNLFTHHFVTYDGVHQDYGASSLLYITLLAVLRSVFASPNLPHAVSSVVHLLLFGGVVLAFATMLPASARAARLAAFSLLALLVTPSALRWLDDGMETGLVVSTVSLVAWLVHRQLRRDVISPSRYIQFAVVAMFAVLLRTELLLLFAFCFLILVAGRLAAAKTSARRGVMGDLLAAAPGCSHLLLGAAAAVTIIVSTMHVLLPDTALAKSHGISHWRDALEQTAVTLGGSLSFGAGMLLFWLVTLLLVVLRARRLTMATLLANSFFPTVLLLASLRGQEIQGVRYFSWTFFFSIVWNILELAYTETALPASQPELRPLYALLGLLVLAMPFESMTMWRVLTHRSETVRIFESQHLDRLQSQRGVAFDIGYIGYFTGANICDLAGLVNGRAKAKLTKDERFTACAATHPDFVFLSSNQIDEMERYMDISQWQVCGRYDLVNVRTRDSHYLLVPPTGVEEACRATGERPSPVSSLLPVQDARR